MRERLNVDTKLQPKQEKFCQEYLIDLNGSKSAIRAGYSEKTSREIASNLLTKVNIQSYIQLLREKQIKRTEVTADKVIKEIARIAFADPRNILDEEMKLKNIHELDENETACIQEINTKHTNIEGLMLSESKYKLHSKIAALDMLSRHLGIFNKDNSQKTNNITIDIKPEANLKAADQLINDIENEE